MQISNKTLIILIILIIILIWYARSAKSDISRYKTIIDTYMADSTDKKPSTKKVRFNLPQEKND